MLARVWTFSLDGLDTRRVAVEVDVRLGLPAFSIVGLGDTAVREARERVRTALQNSAFEFPQRRIVVNLAPAHMRKSGSAFDLAIACGVLAASGQVAAERLGELAIFGELSLSGELRAGRGSLAMAQATRRYGLRGLVLPAGNAREASLIEGLEVAGAEGLQDVTRFLAGGDAMEVASCARVDVSEDHDQRDDAADISDVRGHTAAIEALTIAAAGGHNLLLSGPPGTGKTMLARRLPSILPALTRDEAIEVTRIHSVVGLHRGAGLAERRPFRAPHHTISASGLVGGGPIPAPGEASLAHNGVLFLDELSEFARPALEALRQPLEDGRVAIVRGQHTALFPTRFQLVAATNPCPCGFAGDPRCRCSESDHARHHRRLSGPLLDRLDIVVAVASPTAEGLAEPATHDSSAVKARVVEARERQAARSDRTRATCNAHMDVGSVREHARLDPRAAATLQAAYRQGQLSARGHDRVVRVARTIADLQGSDRVLADHVGQALGLRHHEPREAVTA